MSEWEFRLAGPDDAESFAKWTAENPEIDDADKLSGMKSQNPTVLFFAVTKDGIVQAFAPVYLQMNVAHLGFNPAAEGKDKLRALQVLTDGVSGFAVQFGIREITTLSREEYPVAQWAVKHGFEVDGRQVLKLDLNKVMAEAK